MIIMKNILYLSYDCLSRFNVLFINLQVKIFSFVFKVLDNIRLVYLS